MTTKILLKKLLPDEKLATDTIAELFATKLVTSDDWLKENEEGQLAVDVYQDEKNIVVRAPIAGVKPDDLDISIHNDMVTIRGRREHESRVEEKDYFYRECYWGSFSRSIILPTDVKTEEVEAVLKNGVLTIILPKAQKARLIQVKGLDS